MSRSSQNRLEASASAPEKSPTETRRPPRWATRFVCLLVGIAAAACSVSTASEPDSDGPVGPDDELSWSEGKADSADSASLAKAFSDTDTVSCANAVGPLPPLGTSESSSCWVRPA